MPRGSGNEFLQLIKARANGTSGVPAFLYLRTGGLGPHSELNSKADQELQLRQGRLLGLPVNGFYHFHMTDKLVSYKEFLK